MYFCLDEQILNYVLAHQDKRVLRFLILMLQNMFQKLPSKSKNNNVFIDIVQSTTSRPNVLQSNQAACSCSSSGSNHYHPHLVHAFVHVFLYQCYLHTNRFGFCLSNISIVNVHCSFKILNNYTLENFSLL